MRRLILLRLALGLVGVMIWGYGYRYDLADVRLVAIGILAVVLLLRFVPPRWLGDDPPQ